MLYIIPDRVKREEASLVLLIERFSLILDVELYELRAGAYGFPAAINGRRVRLCAVEGLPRVYGDAGQGTASITEVDAFAPLFF